VDNVVVDVVVVVVDNVVVDVVDGVVNNGVGRGRLLLLLGVTGGLVVVVVFALCAGKLARL